VSVISPDDFLNDWTELLIDGCQYSNAEGAESVTLSLVLPGAYGLGVPGELPWGE
jgi:hypothetical protein